MSLKITKKQKAFADAYLKTGNGTKSALKAYDTKDYNTAAVIATENLTKPKVIQYLESKAEHVAEIIYDLAQNAETDAVKLSASKDILDRAGFGAVDKSVHMNVNTKDLQDQLLRDLNKFRGLKQG